MNWSALLVLLPLVKSLIEMAEDDSPEGTSGADKANAVVTAIGGAWDLLSQQYKIKESWAVVEPLLRLLISLVVSLFNAVGKFKKGDKK